MTRNKLPYLLALGLVAALATGCAKKADEPCGAGEPGAAEAEGSAGEEDPTKGFNFVGFDYGNQDTHHHTAKCMGQDPKTGAAVEQDNPAYDSSEKMSAPFILALVNFAILLFLLARFGGPSIRKLAADRHDEIKHALDDAARLRREAEAKLADYDKRIGNLDAEIAQLVAGLRADAAADKARILAAADAQAAAMKRDAELRIAAEIEYARATLTREVSVAATKATELLLKSQLQPADQEKLVATFISDVQHKAIRAPGGTP